MQVLGFHAMWSCHSEQLSFKSVPCNNRNRVLLYHVPAIQLAFQV